VLEGYGKGRDDWLWGMDLFLDLTDAIYERRGFFLPEVITLNSIHSVVASI